MTKFGPGAQRCVHMPVCDIIRFTPNQCRQTGSTQVGLEVWTQPRPQSCYSNRIIYSDAQNDNTKQTQQGKKMLTYYVTR